jgi:glutamate carboxypeptidase
MRLSSEDRAVLDDIARDGGQIVDRAVNWCAVNSGSRHLAGLERQRRILLDAAASLPAAPTEIPLSPSREVGADGRESEFHQRLRSRSC